MSKNLQQAEQFLSLLFQEDDYVTIACKNPGESELYGARTETRSEALRYASSLMTEGKHVFLGVLPRTILLPNGKKGTRTGMKKKETTIK
jgi:predicted nucleic-acid-binding Zn-ribbon protein